MSLTQGFPNLFVTTATELPAVRLIGRREFTKGGFDTPGESRMADVSGNIERAAEPVCAFGQTRKEVMR